MNFWPYLLVIVVLGSLLLYSQRNRKRQLAQQLQRLSRLGFGSQVMTTSGLYGTIVGRNDDETVQLAIAPGVEVRWALAALRDADALPDRYRPGGADAEQADQPSAAEPPEEGLPGPS